MAGLRTGVQGANLESIRDARSISSKMQMKIAVSIVATAMFALAAASAPASDNLTGDCRIGTYHLEDGTNLDIGATDGPHLRWRRADGTTG